jgi:hypothetical protein
MQREWVVARFLTGTDAALGGVEHGFTVGSCDGGDAGA